MKPALTTEYLHTIHWDTQSYQAEHGLGGLAQVVAAQAGVTIDFDASGIREKKVAQTLRDIMPEYLDELSHERLRDLWTHGMVQYPDLRLILQWLVNKEVLPAGSYVIVF